MNELAITSLLFFGWSLTYILGHGLEWLLGKKRELGVLQVSVFYHSAFVEAFNGDMDLITDVLRMSLLIGTSTTPDSPDHDFMDDIDADEATDASYGRVTLATKTLTDDDANNRAEFDFADVVYSSLDGATIIMAACCVQTGGSDATPTDDDLVALWDIANTTPDTTDFTLQVGSEGAIHWS